MKRVKVNTQPVAAQYAATDETIIEYNHPNGGGLITFRVTDGGVIVDLYRHDDSVTIRISHATGGLDNG